MIYKLDSKLVISTSRKPSQITRRFAQFLKHYFGAAYINRGKASFTKIVNQANEYDNSLLLVITETKGNPSSINVYDLKKDAQNPYANIYINVSLPQANNKINTDTGNIHIINKAGSLEDLFYNCTKVSVDEKIRENCILITDRDDELISASFIDRKGNDTKFKVYVKGFKRQNHEQ